MARCRYPLGTRAITACSAYLLFFRPVCQPLTRQRLRDNYRNKISPRGGDKMLYIRFRNFVNWYFPALLDLIAKMLVIL